MQEKKLPQLGACIPREQILLKACHEGGWKDKGSEARGREDNVGFVVYRVAGGHGALIPLTDPGFLPVSPDPPPLPLLPINRGHRYAPLPPPPPLFRSHM
jgi:hypothetical protein